jgi:hypothetical protein
MPSMNPLDALIEQETAKLRILKEQVAQREQRLATLKGMRSGDDMDAFLAGQLATTGNAGAHPVVGKVESAAQLTIEGGQDDPGPRRKGQTKEIIMLALSPFAQHLKDVHKRTAELGREINYKHLRTQVWALAQGDAPLVESTKAGFYRRTADGQAYVDKLKSENPAGAGFSGATKSEKDEL